MALSAAQKADIVALYGIAPEKAAVVGAGYNEEMFRSAAKPDPAPVQLLYAGKLAVAKGVPWLLRAFGRIGHLQWHLHLVGGGSGEEKDQCLALAKQLKEKVTVYGAVPQPRLADIMRQAHIFVLPSLFEGLPLVLLESLASGCRVIANDLPGVVAILGDVQAEYIRMVETPRLHSLDRPYQEDEEKFEQDWETALGEQISAAQQRPQIDLSVIRNKLAAFSWGGIFRKVERIYFQTLGAG
jgi:glycosyltransferase involved in cell wall biosynthesis